MVRNRSSHLVLVAALAGTLALSACQGPATRVPYIFQIAPDVAVSGAAVSPTGRTPVTDPSVPRHLGVITVNIQGFLNDLTRQRRVLATVADIFYVTVTVKAADGAEFSKTIEKAALINGQTTATFSGLAVGDATVTMKAFDAANRAIGATTKTATIAAGQNTAVDITVTLDPTYTGGSGGGSSTTTGSLTTNGTFVDGPVVNASAPAAGVGSFDVSTFAWGFDLDPQGNLWTIIADTDDSYVTYSPSGAVVATESLGEPNNLVGPSGTAFGADGSRWLVTQMGDVVKFDAAGQEVGRFPQGTINLGFSSTKLKVATDGTLWALGSDALFGIVSLYHVAADLSSVSSVTQGLSMFLYDFDFDSTGNVWAVGAEYASTDPNGEHPTSYLYKLSAAGAIVSRHVARWNTETYCGVIIDPAGAIWIADTGANQLRKFDPTTNQVTSEYFVGWAPDEMVIDADGRLWVGHRDGVSRISAQGQVEETFPSKGVYNLRAGTSGVWGLNNSLPKTILRISH